MSVTNQPRGQGFEYPNEFSAGLFECCTDFTTCLCAIFCGPCFLCNLYKDAGECVCTPFLCPGSDLMLRAKLRAHYKIQGALWKDVCALSFCRLCAIIQMANEIKAHGDN